MIRLFISLRNFLTASFIMTLCCSFSAIKADELFKPQVKVGYGYDSNVFRVKEEIDDFFVQGKVLLPYSAKICSTNFITALGMKFKNFLKEDPESSDDYLARFKFEKQLSSRWSSVFSTKFETEHVDRMHPNTHFADELVQTENFYSKLSANFLSKSLKSAVSYQIHDKNYKDTTRLGEKLNTDDEDRFEHILNGKFLFLPQDSLSPYLETTLVHTSYDQQLDDHLLNRDSKTISFLSGVNYTPSKAIELKLQAGYLARDYSDRSFGTIDDVIWLAELTYEPTKNIELALQSKRHYEDTNIVGSPGYFQDEYIFEFDWQLSPKVKLMLQPAWVKAAFRDLPVELEDLKLTNNFTYAINANFSAVIEYIYTKRFAEPASLEHDSHVGLISLSWHA